MTTPDALNPMELTKKLKGARKKIRRLEGELGSEREARNALEKRVDTLENAQMSLMFNLRRAFKKLGMKPKLPSKDEQG